MTDNKKGQKDAGVNNIAEMHNAAAWNKKGIDAERAKNPSKIIYKQGVERNKFKFSWSNFLNLYRA